MPKYKYVCNSCDNNFELIHLSRDEKAECPECESEDVTRRTITNINLRFKGNGFYKTDYENREE